METIVNKYVVAFIFDSVMMDNVWLIEKQKPQWQKGCLNGIGGKIEENETPLEAMLRELKEEAGIDLDESMIEELGYMGGTNNDGSQFHVTIFSGITGQELTSMEEEKISLYPITDLKNHKTIGNVKALIELSKYKLIGNSAFKRIIMEY